MSQPDQNNHQTFLPSKLALIYAGLPSSSLFIPIPALVHGLPLFLTPPAPLPKTAGACSCSLLLTGLLASHALINSFLWRSFSSLSLSAVEPDATDTGEGVSEGAVNEGWAELDVCGLRLGVVGVG